MELSGKHILSTKMFNLDGLQNLFDLADILTPVARGVKKTRVLEGAVLASLFFEPSTRTRLSFDSAFMRLGGSVSHTTSFDSSSIVKGESLYDTSRVISGYADAIVIRHPTNGAVAEFAAATNIPVINGGCGSEEHPTQSLLDLYTINSELGRAGLSLSNATILFTGDLKYGRTVHSLLRLLSLTKGLRYIFASPKSLSLPDEYLSLIAQSAESISEINSLDNIPANVDVIYSTRIQRERLLDSDETPSGNFRMTKAILDATKAKCVMHPLPRDSRDFNFNIDPDLNSDSRFAAFRQSDSGIQIRMALFCKVLNIESQVVNSLRDVNWWRPNLLK